ncbi:MAG: InlB B-repeat-containing protein [Paludibacteraceae bacterium]|nr:InlB B-repeat-containing protein [Paludibacteraceae bacterium]
MKIFFTKTENNASITYPYSGGIGKKLRATLALPLRYLCAALLLLTLGVGQEAKAIGFNQGNIFFDATGWGTTNYVYFAVGKDDYTSLYQLNTPVSNTNLYRAWASNNGWWNGCNYFAVFSTSGSWGSGSWGYTNISGNASCYTGKYTSAYDIDSGNIYVITKASSSNGAAMSIDYQAGITGLNSSQTVTVQVKTANAANYSNAANCYGTSISSATHYFNTAWDSADQDGAVALSNSTVTGNASAALSSTVSLSLSGAVTTGYQFDGWYYSDGTLISTSTSASYTVRGATTVYARFSEKKFNVTAAKTPSAGGTVTPSSATAMGQITGGAITATPATGYTFTSWAVTSGTGSFVSSTSTASNTYKPTSASTVTATFTPKTYSITLDKNGGASGGSATATYNSSTLTSVTHASRASYDLTGYYDATSAGTKIINANGTLVAGTTYTDASGNWTYDDDVTLYAQWDYNPVTYSVTYGVGTSYSSLGSLAATNTSTSAAITSGTSYESGTGITFTASPNTGYTVEGWYTDATCTSAIGAAGTSNPYAITLSGNTTVYVKFVEATWSVAFAAGTGGTVTTPNSTPQTVGQITGISIAATPGTGYTFASWSSSNGGSFTSGTSTNANTFKPTANTTVTASFNETMSSLSTSCSYDAGTPGYAAPTVSNSATTIGYGTTRTITAAAAGTGYTFAGWTITNGTRTDGGGATANPITVRSNGDGAAVSVVANYEEDLTTPWTLKGGTNLTGNNWATEYNLEKKTGHSTESVAYYTFSVSSTNSGIDGTADAWSFKLINNSTWYGLTASGSYWWLSNTAANQPLSTSGANIQICATVAGDYEVKVDYTTPASPTVTVTFPTSYTLTYSVGTVPGNNGSISTSPSTASGSQVLSGTNITLTAPAAKTGYTWSGWYTNSAGSEGKINDTNRAITVTMNAAKTLYACYTEDKYTVAFNNGDHGTVSPSGDQQVGVSGTSVTATPAAGWRFVDWSKTGAGVSLSSTTTNPTTVTASCTGSVTPNYAHHYILRGSTVANDATTAGMAGWSATDNSSYASATISDGVMTITANLTSAGTQYKFMIYDFVNSSYSGQTGTGEMSDGDTWTLNGSNDVKLTTTVAGTYTFVYNTSTGSMTVTYPAETGYTVTANASAGGAAGAASYTAYQYTTTAITATPSTGYYFTGWEATSGSVDFADASSASTTINGVTAAATIRANFAPIWRILGSEASNTSTGTDGFGGWDKDNTTATIVNIGTNLSSKDTGYVELTLEANKNYEFKMLDRQGAGTYYGNGGDKVYYMDYGNHTAWGFGTDKSYNCGITTAGAGNYKFAWNMTDKTLTVTYPTSYTVTFGMGTGGSEVTATVEDATTITSGQYAAAGKDITFTQTPSTGYTFKGWYTTSDGNSAVTGMGTSDAVYDDIAANINVYAQYTEGLHTVTVTAGEHGSITTPAGGSGSTVSAGVSTGAAVVAAVADYGYYFQGWTVESGSATFADASALSTTVYATADATIKANFVSHWTIAGGDSGDSDGADAMGDWSTVANGIDNFEEVNSEWIGYADIDLPANTTFWFKVRDLFNSNWYGNTGEMTIDNSTGWEMRTDESTNCRITTAGKGTYRFTWNETTHHLTVTYPPSYTVSYSVYTFLGNDESNSESTTGGSISSVVDGDAIALTSGKYVVSGGTAVFTHAAATTNYHFAGWYSDAACETAYVDGEGGAAIADEVLTLTVSGNKTVYAKFAENMTTVNIAHNTHGHVELGGATVTYLTAGTVTTRSITAIPDAGYYFAGWTVTEGSDFTPSATGEDNTTITVTGRGAGETTGQTLTANFVELDKVYFRNWNADSSEPLWENVYVYFNIYYEDDCAKSNASSDSIAAMTQEGASNVYWAYIPRQTTRSGRSANIAFSNHNFGANYKFYSEEAVMRGDYRKGLDMFVPQHGSSSTGNETKYYNGYWKHHNAAVDSDAGYRIERYTGSGYTQPADNGGDRVKFLVAGENTVQYQLRIDNLTSGHNNYMIYSLAGIHYVTFDSSPSETGYTITTSNFSDIGLSEYNSGSPRFYITPTSENIYTLTIDMSGDVMRLTVTYPVSVGDHRLKHTYTSGSAKSTYSDVIKSTDATKKLSMYFDNTTSHSPSLKLQKCTALNNGVPTWGSETTVAMTGVKADTMGVFVFDLAVDGDAGSISNTAPYDGEYYVKADSLPGNWSNYKQNVMLLNTNTFDKDKPTTFDRYMCHWYGNGNGSYNTNIKCVVANEYNNQLTDTLFGDAVIGMENQTLPNPGNVRFSYNSTTNELKRTYINGASDWMDEFLLVSGSYRIKATDGTALHNNDTTLHDENNWTYQVDIKAAANSNVLLTAKFNNQRQLLLGSTSFTDSVQIVGGSSDKSYNMRLVYDFKTDYLIAGYLAGDNTFAEDDAIYSDVLIIRQEQGPAEQIKFATGKKLTKVQTVYGVMQFRKSYLTDGSLSRYSRNTYWISFPFDVKLSDVVGFGSYGTQWIIQYYDGAGRASKGLWKETPTYWTHVSAAQREAGFVMKANVGYILSLSLNNTSASSNIWDNGVTLVSLYFPSKDPVQTIDGELPEAGAYVVPAHPVTFQGAERDNRSYKDAHWNVIGVPSYANVTKAVNSATEINENDVPFLYTYNFTTNRMTPANVATDVIFGATQSYLVQYAGTINWRLTTIPLGMAARRNQTAENDSYTLCLNLDKEDENMDKAYIRFTDDATVGLDMNKDLTKNFNSGIDNIYTICEDVELAAQILPLGDETVYIPVGVKAASDGTCTFSMPAGTDGLEVYLFDREANKHINMLTSTYDADLTKGDINDRFVLEVRRAQMPTGIFTTDNADEDVTKYMHNGHLYIKKGQYIYNAEGKRVTNVQ